MKNLFGILQRGREWLESEAIPRPRRDPPASQALGTASQVVILLLDSSGSMGLPDYPPTRLEGGKQAIRGYLDKLEDNEPDTFVGIVAFGSTAKVLCRPVQIRENGSEIRDALRKDCPEGSTNTGDGLLVASRLIKDIALRNSRIILLTDGYCTDEPNPVTVAGDLKSEGTQIDIIGIGGSPASVNEAELRTMASVVDGQIRYWFIRSKVELVRKFEALALREIQ